MLTLSLTTILLALPGEATAVDPALPEIERRGDGDVPMLLIPCMSGRWRQWDRFMERNRDLYRMTAVTLPGFGGGAAPDLGDRSGPTPWHDHATESVCALIAQDDLNDLVLVSHSWGTSVALRAAARMPGRVRALINVDGWLTDSVADERRSPDARRASSARILAEQTAALADPERWSRFNWIELEDPKRSLLYHGMFMASDRRAVVAYWSENPLLSLNPMVRRLTDVEILNISAISASVADPEAEEARRLEQIDELQLGAHLTTVFFQDTRHHVPEQRPWDLDRVIEAFLEGESLDDLRPTREGGRSR